MNQLQVEIANGALKGRPGRRRLGTSEPTVPSHNAPYVQFAQLLAGSSWLMIHASLFAELGSPCTIENAKAPSMVTCLSHLFK